MKQAVDIEDLLIWAYRDQCVETAARSFRPRGPAGYSAAAASLLTLGTRVDTSGVGTVELGARYDDDALTIDAAVHALPDAWAWFRAWDEVIVVDRVQAAALGLDPRVLVDLAVVPTIIRHARVGTRPDWHPEWKRAEGRPATRAADARKHRRHKPRDGVTDAGAMVARAGYVAWWQALARLAGDLGGQMSRYEPLPLRDSPTPWSAKSQNSNGRNPLK